jgi:hypothetical protein
MPRLPRSLAAWRSDAFAAALKAEVQALGPVALPLHRLASTGHALDTQVSVTLIGSWESEGTIVVRLGVFFEEILPGCSCGDEPEPQPAYGEMVLSIDKSTAQVLFEPLAGWAA